MRHALDRRRRQQDVLDLLAAKSIHAVIVGSHPNSPFRILRKRRREHRRLAILESERLESVADKMECTAAIGTDPNRSVAILEQRLDPSVGQPLVRPESAFAIVNQAFGHRADPQPSPTIRHQGRHMERDPAGARGSRVQLNDLDPVAPI